MAINFPDTSGSPPTDGSFTHTEAGLTYAWDGEKWILIGNQNSDDSGYVLPTATAIRLGGIKVGDNLSVTPDGVLSADADDTVNTLQEVTDAGNTTTNGATFGGKVDAGGGGGSTENQAVVAHSNASASAANATVYARNLDSTGNVFVGVDGAGSTNSTIAADGSAEFAGKITSASTESTDSGTTLVTKDYLEGSDGLGDLDLQAVTDNGNTTTNGASFGGDVGIGGGPTFGSLTTIDRQLNIYETGSGSVTGISFGGNESTNYIYAQNGTTTTIDLAPSEACGVRIGGTIAGEFPDRIARFSAGGLDIGGTLEEDDPLIKGNIILSKDGSAELGVNGSVNGRINLRPNGTDVSLEVASGALNGNIWTLANNGTIVANSSANATNSPNYKLDATDGSAEFDNYVAVPNSTDTNRSALTKLGVSSVRDTIDQSKKVWSGFGGTTETSTINSDGSASFAGDVDALMFDTDPNGGGVRSLRAAGGALQVWRGGLSTSNITSEIFGDGSASFSGGDISLNADGSAVFESEISCKNWGVAAKSSRLSFGLLSTINDDGTQYAFRSYLNGYAVSDVTAEIKADGSATFTGAVTAPNVTFSLEPDNPVNFNAEGEYTGPTLDVKDRLTKANTALTAIKTAATDANTDLAGLKAAIVSALADF